MKKIPSLFVRDYETVMVPYAPVAAITGVGPDAVRPKKGRFLATEQVTPGCEWVIAGEGVATRKWDGTAVMLKRGVFYKRFDAKHGKNVPEYFEPCQDPDPITGHWPGWVPVYEHLPENRWIIEALSNTCDGIKPHGLPDGTYEAIGPKINGFKDKEHVSPNDRHILTKHGTFILEDAPPVRNYETLRHYLSYKSMEGIVFHHPDGRMCKVKRSDFGLPW